MSDARLLRSVQRLATVLARMERQAAAAAGVSVSQMRVLVTLSQSPETGLSISDLADGQALAVSTMTRNVAVLEGKGWIRREAGQRDRRTVLVHLTGDGSSLAARLSDSNLARFARAFSAFHPSDRVERAVALDRVASALERSDEK